MLVKELISKFTDSELWRSKIPCSVNPELFFRQNPKLDFNRVSMLFVGCKEPGSTKANPRQHPSFPIEEALTKADKFLANATYEVRL